MHTIIVRNGEGDERRIPSTATLEATKAFAEDFAQPGQRVRIVTSRGSTWVLQRDCWRHDTGRSAALIGGKQ